MQPLIQRAQVLENRVALAIGFVPFGQIGLHWDVHAHIAQGRFHLDFPWVRNAKTRARRVCYVVFRGWESTIDVKYTICGAKMEALLCRIFEVFVGFPHSGESYLHESTSALAGLDQLRNGIFLQFHAVTWAAVILQYPIENIIEIHFIGARKGEPFTMGTPSLKSVMQVRFKPLGFV